MARVLVPLAEGFEEIEMATIVDVLRRAGVDVVVVGLAGQAPCRGSRGLFFVPDTSFTSAPGPWDMVVVPGGLWGTERCMRHTGLLELIRELVATGRTVASICTAARVLDAAGVLPDRYTCYPGVEEQLSNQHRSDELLVDTGSVITSQGPGTAMQFALYLAGKLSGEERRQVVAGSLLAN